MEIAHNTKANKTTFRFYVNYHRVKMAHTGTFNDRIERVKNAFEEKFDNINKISNTPEGSDWNNGVYEEFLKEALLLDRQSLDGSAGHAMQFWRWYSGVEDYCEEFTYSVFHGVLSYVKLDGAYVLPDTLIAKESSAATKNTPATGSPPVVKAWSFLSKRGDKPVDKMRVDTSKGTETVNYETCATWVKFFYDRLLDNTETEDKNRSVGNGSVEARMRMIFKLSTRPWLTW